MAGTIEERMCFALQVCPIVSSISCQPPFLKPYSLLAHYSDLSCLWAPADRKAGMGAVLSSCFCCLPQYLSCYPCSNAAFEAMFEALDINATRLLESDRLLSLLLPHISLGMEGFQGRGSIITLSSFLH